MNIAALMVSGYVTGDQKKGRGDQLRTETDVILGERRRGYQYSQRKREQETTRKCTVWTETIVGTFAFTIFKSETAAQLQMDERKKDRERGFE